MEQEGGRENPRFCSKKLAVEDDWGWNWWLPPASASTMSHETSGGRHQIHSLNQVKWVQPNQVIRRSHFGETKPSLFPDFDLFRRWHSAVVIWLFEMGSRPNNTTTVNFEANTSTTIKKGLRCSSPSLHISLCHKMPNLATPAQLNPRHNWKTRFPSIELYTVLITDTFVEHPNIFLNVRKSHLRRSYLVWHPFSQHCRQSWSFLMIC